MHILASEINAALEGSAAYRLLSDFGRRIYFPKGIIAQAAEAKKLSRTANATIGMAASGGRLMRLQALAENLPLLSEEESVAYAPTAGLEKTRELWREQLLAKNPSLKKEYISLPAVVPGITAGISYTADLFLDKGQRLITSDPCWDNYALIVEERRQASLRPVRCWTQSGLDLDALKAAIDAEAKTGAVRIILNFPNNPAGYAPTEKEADALCGFLSEAAEKADVLAICDDAYFGLYYEENTFKESLFSRLSSLHERVLAVKADGPTKEDYVWGLRAAFLTFGSKAMRAELSAALVSKLMGTIRSSVSCSNTPAQTLLQKTLMSEKTAAEKQRFYEILKRRYNAVRAIVDAQSSAHKGHPVLKALPFNSGYFMSFECAVDAERLRKTLLEQHGIGTIAFGTQYLRVAFSSIEEAQIAPVMETIYSVAEEAGK